MFEEFALFVLQPMLEMIKMHVKHAIVGPALIDFGITRIRQRLKAVRLTGLMFVLFTFAVFAVAVVRVFTMQWSELLNTVCMLAIKPPIRKAKQEIVCKRAYQQHSCDASY